MPAKTYRVTFQLEEVDEKTGDFIRPLSSSSSTFPVTEVDMTALKELLNTKLTTFAEIMKVKP
jgi:hypothetical protein